jgi:hypothetical protein
MQLAKPQVSVQLQHALRSAKPHERLRVVIVVRPPERGPSGVGVDPRRYRSQEDYRRALVEMRGREMSEETATAREELERLGLRVHGGESSRALVIEGEAQAIETALESTDIAHASIDEPLQLSLGVPGAKR